MSFSSAQQTETYSFNLEGFPFDFILTFNQVFDPPTNPFSVDVEASTTLAQPVPAGSVCVPIGGPGDCVDFLATTTAVKGTDYNFYTVTIDWVFDTNFTFPNDGGHQIELLESHAGGPFLNITIPGSYFPGCPEELICGDPGISGQSDSFSNYTVIDTTAPEPATLALLGTGLTGLLMRYRRRQRS
jgi:hypothetical protein